MHPFFITPVKHATGEVIPTIIREPGLPCLHSLRWTLMRRHEVALGTLLSEVRKLSVLYESYERQARSLDEELADDRLPSAEDLETAMGWAICRNEPALVGSVVPTEHGAIRGERLSQRQINNYARVWADFCVFMSKPRSRRAGTPWDRTRAAAEERHQYLEDIRDFYFDAVKSPGGNAATLSVGPDELDTIERVIGPDELDQFPPTFAPEHRLRNWLLFSFPRWVGIRRGETLKLYVDDLPSRTPDGHLHILRRPDDAQDTRAGRAPAVKTSERKLVIPDFLSASAESYVTRTRPRSRSPYLFVGGSGEALSLARADDVMRRIGHAAALWWEEHRPGEPHSLRRLRWHRLRHTRAQELCPLYLDDPESGGLEEFRSYFGWSHPDSMRVYVNAALEARANRRLEGHLKSLLASSR